MYHETLDDIPFDQELEGSDEYESAFPDEDAEDIEAAVFKPAMSMPELDDIQQSLEALLADAVTQQRKRGEIKGLRKAAKRQDLPKEDREALLKKIRSWEDTYEWNTEAYVAMFQEDLCQSCGSDSRHFMGYFYRQNHKTQAIRRIVRVEESEVYAQDEKNKFFPRQILVRQEKKLCCSLCVVGQGFPYSSIEVLV
jgi:hypothetical protein